MTLKMILITTRMPAELIKELKDLADQETIVRGEPVSLGSLIRDGARRTLKQAKRGGAAVKCHKPPAPPALSI
jgi:hypothetical protein